MVTKIISAVLTVLAGVGGAFVLYWLLNKLSEILPGKW
jgi:alpha-glucoside transport system permease protein